MARETVAVSVQSSSVLRDHYGALTSTPEWVGEILRDLNGRAWTTGIQSDRKRRGSAINTALYSYDAARRLAVVQVRQCVFHPRRFSQVRKSYYLIGRVEDGSAFAHPVDIRAAGRVVGEDLAAGVRLALARVWDCDEADLADIVRNGDVAFIPVSKIPENAELVADNHVVIRETHHVRSLAGGEILTAGGVYFVRGRAKIEHSKSEHPTARVRMGLWRVQAGVRARAWDFSAPVGD